MPSTKPPRCLLVEDVEAMRALLGVLLGSSGCEIFAAGSLEEARHMLRSQPVHAFDFVVLDLQLPDGDGLELLPEIDQGTKVVALTADDSRETYLQCISAGCAHVLNKSGELTRLREILLGSTASAPEKRQENTGTAYPYMRYLAEVRIELEIARRKRDLLGLRRIAHRLRGTAVHYGHPGIGRAAKSISTALASGNLDRIDIESLALSERIARALEVFYLRERNDELLSASSTAS